jgi:AcrR family transcriptional regulator
MAEDVSNDGGTRSRILDVAWSLIVARGLTEVSMGEIARDAGVSRQALYLHFGSRGGLLVAMARHHDDTSPRVARLRRLREESLPSERWFEEYFDVWLDYVPDIFPVAQALSTAAATDPEANLAWNDRMDALRAGIARVIQSLQKAGSLKPEWSLRTATDWAWSQAHVDVWRHLVVERRWNPKDAKARIMTTLRAGLLHDGGSRTSAQQRKGGRKGSRTR